MLIIDDYGHWAGAREAVDEFFAGRGGRTAAQPGGLHGPHRGEGPDGLEPQAACPENSAHHRHHRPGRLVPGRAAARAGLRRPRHGAPLVDREVRAHRAHPRPDHAAPGRPARPALARRRAAGRQARRDLQPRGDELRRRVVDPADADRGVHRRGRDPHARGHARGLPRGALLPGVLDEMFGKVREVPQTEDDAVLSAVAVRRGQGVRALHHGQLP